MARLWAPSGLGADTPVVTLGSGLVFTVPDGLYGWNRGFLYKNSGAQNKTATNNGNTNPRIDRLVLRLDRTANTITPVIIEGTPGASPVAPGIDAAKDILVARATCPGSGSAQNYSSLVQEWFPVSSARGRHVWHHDSITVTNGNIGTFGSWTQVRSDGIATMTSGNLKLNLPGQWAIRLFVQSSTGGTGTGSPILGWTGGPWAEQNTETDTRSAVHRGSSHYFGLVLYPEAQQNITQAFEWVGATASIDVFASLYVDYLGG